MRRSVVVTGIGAVTAIGSGSSGLWHGVREGRSGIRPISRFDPSPFRSKLAAEVDGFDLETSSGRGKASRLDRFARFGVAAARQAVEDASLCIDRADRSRMGVSLGSALGGVAYGEEQHAAYLHDGVRAVGPTLAIAVYGGAAGAHIAIQLGLNGPSLAHASSCAAGTNAIGDAFRTIQRGEADVMLAGGAEAPLAPLTFGAFSLIKAMSARDSDPEAACRPFDRDRDGFVMGEGAAVLVLEEEEHALGRGARSYARLLGYAQTTDAYHMTAPRPDGSEAARAIGLALKDASVLPQEVDYVNAHATGTPVGDSAEARALVDVFGSDGGAPWVSATKALYGHPLGASGAIELAITALALHHGFLPGTTNFHESDEACELRIIPPPGRDGQASLAVSTSFGFGGANAAIVVAAPDFSPTVPDE